MHSDQSFQNSAITENTGSEAPSSIVLREAGQSVSHYFDNFPEFFLILKSVTTVPALTDAKSMEERVEKTLVKRRGQRGTEFSEYGHVRRCYLVIGALGIVGIVLAFVGLALSIKSANGEKDFLTPKTPGA